MAALALKEEEEEEEKADGETRRLQFLSGEASPAVPGYGAVSQSNLDQDSLEAGCPSFRRGVSDLPDLTERLKEAGIYAEYHAFRSRYLQWRRGAARGAVGELTASALAETSDPYKFEFWYPTASIFKWRFTTAYWIAILYMLGSFLFTFTNGIAFFHGPGGIDMLHWLNGTGAVCFTLAAYFAYLQLINISTQKEERVAYLVPDFKELSKRVVASSAVGVVSYFLGAVAFNVGALAMFYPFERVDSKIYFIALPNFLGSVGFATGGICEVIHNRIIRGGSTPAELVWWATIANVLGDFLFLSGSVPDLFFMQSQSRAKDNMISLTYGIGSAMFILSSILMLAMWRVNDFGLTLIKQLNFAIKCKGFLGVARPSGPKALQEHIGLQIHMPENTEPEEEDENRLSARGAMFIIIYTWFAFVAIVNCTCKHIWYENSPVPHALQHFLDLGMQLFALGVIGLVLVIHSVVTEVPDEQPYHFALVASRFVLVSGAIIQTSIMVTFLAPRESLHKILTAHPVLS